MHGLLHYLRRDTLICISLCHLVFERFMCCFIYAFTHTDGGGTQKGSGPGTYTGTSQNLSKKRNGVVFVSELVSYQVIHLWDTDASDYR